MSSRTSMVVDVRSIRRDDVEDVENGFRPVSEGTMPYKPTLETLKPFSINRS
jgi:hypothetical protein